jgi:hypothetical protein
MIPQIITPLLSSLGIGPVDLKYSILIRFYWIDVSTTPVLRCRRPPWTGPGGSAALPSTQGMGCTLTTHEGRTGQGADASNDRALRSRPSLVNTGGSGRLRRGPGSTRPVDTGLLPGSGLTNGGPRRYEPWVLDARPHAPRKQRVVKAVAAPAEDVDKHGSGLTRGPEAEPRESLTTGMTTVNGRGLTAGWGMMNGTGMTREPGFHRDNGRVNGSGVLMTSSLASAEGMTNGSGLTGTEGLASGGGMTNGNGLTRGEGLTNGCGLAKGPGTFVPPPERPARGRRGLLRSIVPWGQA